MSTLQLYGKFAVNVLGGEAAGDAGQMDFLSDVIKATLHTTTYTPNVDTDEAFADATNELATANGYTAGGITIAGKSAVYTAAGGISTFDMDDTTVTWTASGAGITFRYVVFHDDTVAVGPPIKPLIGYIDYTGGGNITIPNTGILLVTTGASGLFTGTVTGA
jgi:hypothetical protein